MACYRHAPTLRTGLPRQFRPRVRAAMADLRACYFALRRNRIKLAP